MVATLIDVARRAGVSSATASRVLNGRRHVAAATRLRVEEAAAALDYIPNRAARDLSLARTATVSLLGHHRQYPEHGEGTFSSRVIDGASATLREARYDLLYVPVSDAEVHDLSRLAAVRADRSDGVLLLGPAFPRRAAAAIAASGRPMVAIDARVPGVDVVLADNRPAMAELASHLVTRHGCRRIACLAGPAAWPSTRERVAGIRDALHGTGTILEVLHARETTMRDGATLTGRLLDDPPDAIMAVNDAMAIGATHRLRGIAPARRPAVTGFDDVAWARLMDPPLTTVAVDAAAMGSAAARQLLTRINDADDTGPGREIRVPASVRIRASCGCGDPARPLPDAGGG